MYFQGGDLHNVQVWQLGHYLGYIDNHAGPHDHHPAQGSSADFGEVLLIILALEQKNPKSSGHLWSGHLGILEDGILPGSTCSCLLWGLEVLEQAEGVRIEIFLENTDCRRAQPSVFIFLQQSPLPNRNCSASYLCWSVWLPRLLLSPETMSDSHICFFWVHWLVHHLKLF